MADKTGYIGRNPADSSVKIARQTFEPTGVQTDFTFASGYDIGYLDLFLNGSKLIEGSDYQANDGSNVGLTTYAQSGDVLEAVAYKAFNVGDSSASSTGNFTVGNDLIVSNDASVSNDLNVTGIGTVGQGFNVTAGGVNATGVITATSFSGDGSALTGVANTDYVVGTAITMVKANFTDVNVSGSATVDGQLSVGGTITYEDVTQVDSVGIVTARLGIRVLSGGIQVVGLTTGLNATGVSTFATINATSYDEIEYDTWLFG
jgi:hypothetical protein